MAAVLCRIKLKTLHYRAKCYSEQGGGQREAFFARRVAAEPEPVGSSFCILRVIQCVVLGW